MTQVEFFGLTPWEWVLPLLIGIIAGLATNALAIWMLFHPYQPVYLGRLRVMPMGAIPKEIDRIAQRIGETVGKELLTHEDIARTLSSDTFRARFDDALRGALATLIERDLGALRDRISPEQAAGVEVMLERVLAKAVEALETYFQSADWEDRVRGFAHNLSGEFRERPFSVVLTPELQADLRSGVAQLWAGVRESPELARLIAEALDRGIGNMVTSEKPLRHYVPSGAVNLGETFVANYLPLLLDRLGKILDDGPTRERLQATLRRFVNRFLDEQQTWKRIVGRLVITERTLAQTVEAIEQGGVDEIAALLREPEVQTRVAAAVNEGVEDLLDRQMKDLLGDISPERAERLRQMLVERVLYLFRHPTTEDVLLRRFDYLLASAADRTVGDLLSLLGESRSRDLSDRAADWILDTLRGERAIGFVRGALENRTAWMLGVRIGRLGDYLPPDAVDRAESMMFDPLWIFLQKRVPDAVTGLPVAQMVERKLKSYPIQKVEELIWRVSRRELVLIIYLGGFLGALIGSMMLITSSIPAGLLASGVFILLSFIFINLKG
jgi:uncharacterized membrane protein YheB (UPF0754 family)